MNIHFTDEDIFKEMYQNSLAKVEFGSVLYGINDENSDKDIMCIYADTNFEKGSLFINHHQFQYKKDGIDYIFTSLSNFIKNSLNGDATINYEIMQSGILKDTLLHFLYEESRMFSNYEIIRSYLGFGKRDLERWEKEKGDREQNKKIIHGIRSFKFASDISSSRNGYLIMDCSELNEFKNIDRAKRIELSQHFRERISELRTIVNNNINNYQRRSTMEQQKMLDEFVSSFNPTFEFPKKLITEIYKSNEFGIEY